MQERTPLREDHRGPSENRTTLDTLRLVLYLGQSDVGSFREGQKLGAATLFLVEKPAWARGRMNAHTSSACPYLDVMLALMA